MKLIELVNAKDALKQLTEKRFTNYKLLRQLVKLRKAVESEAEFYGEEERKAIEQYSEKDENGHPVFITDGRLKLIDSAAKDAFEKQIEELGSTEVDDIEPVSLSEADFISPDDFPTANDMSLLECIVHFED